MIIVIFNCAYNEASSSVEQSKVSVCLFVTVNKQSAQMTLSFRLSTVLVLVSTHCSFVLVQSD